MEEEKQSNILVDKAKEAAKKKGKKVAKQAVKKAAKVAAKAVANAAIAVVKSIVSFLLAVLSPYLLLIIAILFAVIIIYISTVLIFSDGDDETLGDERAIELRNYIIEQSEATVDPDKPEQAEYAVPPELAYAILQIYESMGASERESKKAAKTVITKLAPKFEYDKYTEKTESYSVTCDKDGCDTSSTRTDKNEVTYLAKVEAWNGTTTTDPGEGTWSSWSSSSSSHTVTYTEDGEEKTDTVTKTTYTRDLTFELESNYVEDYSALVAILTSKPFEFDHDDILMVEALFNLAGGYMNYSGSYGSASDYSDLYTGYDISVIPGSNVPAQYVPIYIAAQKKYGAPWYYIAAVHWIETSFSTNVKESWAGATGHTQFMPCTWQGWANPTCKGTNGKGNITKADLVNPSLIKKYGGYGVDANGDGKADPMDIEDAIFTTAKLLVSGGIKSDPQKAIFNYNHDSGYVSKVMNKADEIKNAATVTETGEIVVQGRVDEKNMIHADWNEFYRLMTSVKGAPYKLGGITPSGMDCTGFMIWGFGKLGFQFGERVSYNQWDWLKKKGYQVPASQRKPGDIVYFDLMLYNGSKVDHAGLYIGNGKVLHTYKVGIGVVIEDLDKGWSNKGVVGYARPVIFE